MERWIRLLSTLAEDIESGGSARIAAGLVIKNRMVAVGTCQNKSHPFQARYAKNEHAHFWHAETNAVYNALRRHDSAELRRATLVVVRRKFVEPNRSEVVYGLARPCAGCRECIRDHGIRRLVYTLDSRSMKYVTESLDSPA